MFKVHVVWFFFYKFGLQPLHILVGEISPGLLINLTFLRSQFHVRSSLAEFIPDDDDDPETVIDDSGSSDDDFANLVNQDASGSSNSIYIYIFSQKHIFYHPLFFIYFYPSTLQMKGNWIIKVLDLTT